MASSLIMRWITRVDPITLFVEIPKVFVEPACTYALPLLNSHPSPFPECESFPMMMPRQSRLLTMSLPIDLEASRSIPLSSITHHDQNLGKEQSEAAKTNSRPSESTMRSEGTSKPTPKEAGRLDPSTKFSGRQLYYVFVVNGLVAMILSGGINFTIAYGK